MLNLYCLLYNASYQEKLFESASMNNKMAYIYQRSSKIRAYSHFISALSQNCTNLSTVQKIHLDMTPQGKSVPDLCRI